MDKKLPPRPTSRGVELPPNPLHHEHSETSRVEIEVSQRTAILGHVAGWVAAHPYTRALAKAIVAALVIAIGAYGTCQVRDAATDTDDMVPVVNQLSTTLQALSSSHTEAVEAQRTQTHEIVEAIRGIERRMDGIEFAGQRRDDRMDELRLRVERLENKLTQLLESGWLAAMKEWVTK